MGDMTAEEKAAANHLVKKVSDALSKKYELGKKVSRLLFDSWFTL